MRSTAFLALTGLFALAAAAPMKRRDIRWVTEVALEIKTAVVTETVWVLANGAVASPAAATPTASVLPLAYTPKVKLSSATSAAPSSSSTPTPTPAPPVAATTPSPSPSIVIPSPAPVVSSIQLQAFTPSSAPPAPLTSSSSSIVEAPTSIYTPPPAPSTTETPSSVYTPPPAPSTTETPTPAYTPPAATPSAAPGVSGLSYGMAAAGKSYTGDITWYQTGMGSCGINSGSSDHIVAISEVIMDAYNTGNPNNNPLCNKGITITYNGQSYPATVVDRCTGCDESSIDLSEGFFQEITGNTGLGRVGGVTWVWN